MYMLPYCMKISSFATLACESFHSYINFPINNNVDIGSTFNLPKLTANKI